MPSDTISRAAVLAAIEAMPPNIYDLGDKYVCVDQIIAAINALPAVTVTDNMVERAAIAFYNDAPGHGRCINDAMRCALEAAIPSGKD